MTEQSHGHFILDVSALTKGLGNIKKWIEGEQYDIKLFIPSYTIHELDYLKKGTSVIATNARESIRFIEKIVTDESCAESSDLILETAEESGPSWKTCVKYKTRAPKVFEFKSTRSRPSAIQYERDVANKFINDEDEEDKETRAEIPTRLKYLIRPCIKKVKFDEEEWKLITEDSTVKIWCESFGIKCLNISEAESELFHNKTEFETELTQSTSSRIRKSRNKKRITRGNKPASKDENGVIVEKFNSMSYASRGSGELWVP